MLMIERNVITGEVTERPYTAEELAALPRPEQVAAEAQRQSNAIARAFLRDSDWYVTRFTETGVAIPDDIKAQREAARVSIVE